MYLRFQTSIECEIFDDGVSASGMVVFGYPALELVADMASEHN